VAKNVANGWTGKRGLKLFEEGCEKKDTKKGGRGINLGGRKGGVKTTPVVNRLSHR